MVRMLIVIVMLGSVGGCHPFDPSGRMPLGHSTDENGRPCSTYQSKLDGVHETVCDHGGSGPSGGTVQ
jgi:hypothetical protein